MSIEVKEHNLNDPKGRREFREFIANYVISAVSSTLGSGFTVIDSSPMKNDYIWREVRIEIAAIDKIHTFIQRLCQDIVMTGVRRFVRLSLMHEVDSIVELNGICLRVALELYPKPIISIDYAGYK